ncbi:hypothetical protein GYMLUDRAFT_983262 [Collybiopsis luxurians FD-317 M1]|nr:hypothetical protein GYMLUDRAFT_983262 [Collybiopsis luxurians FD-317 M1]
MRLSFRLITILSSVTGAYCRLPQILRHFTGFEGLFGITEVQPDQFYVLAGNASSVTLTSVVRSWTAFRVDTPQFNKKGTAAVIQIATFPDGQLLNGMGIGVCNGSFRGINLHLKHQHGLHYVATNNSLTVPGPPFTTLLGVNGVHTFRESNGQLYVYFSKHRTGLTRHTILARMPITFKGTPTDSPEVIATGILADDFTFDLSGNVLQAVIGSSEIAKIDPTTKSVTVVADSPNGTDPRSCSAAQFRRLKGDTSTLSATLNDGNLGQGGVLGL